MRGKLLNLPYYALVNVKHEKKIKIKLKIPIQNLKIQKILKNLKRKKWNNWEKFF